MKYHLRPLPCRPWTLLEMSSRLTESHYENNYGEARGARPAEDSRGAPRLWLNVGQPMRPLAILGWIFRTVRVWRILKRTRRQLAELDDRQLRDVGLTRGQALREHSKPFWKL